jgi:hypothetical protein
VILAGGQVIVAKMRLAVSDHRDAEPVSDR